MSKALVVEVGGTILASQKGYPGAATNSGPHGPQGQVKSGGFKGTDGGWANGGAGGGVPGAASGGKGANSCSNSDGGAGGESGTYGKARIQAATVNGADFSSPQASAAVDAATGGKISSFAAWER